MKKILLIAAVTMMSTSAIASKARKTALGSAAHLSDVNDILTKPDQAMNHGDSAIFELGNRQRLLQPVRLLMEKARAVLFVKWIIQLGVCT